MYHASATKFLLNLRRKLYALPEAVRAGRWFLLIAISLCALGWGAISRAQDEATTPQSTPAADDGTTLSVAEPDTIPGVISGPAPSATPTPTPQVLVVPEITAPAPKATTKTATQTAMATATTTRESEFGRTIVLVLGGVSWSDWLSLASQTSTATPGFRRVLEEGALGAAFLPGGQKDKNRDNRNSDTRVSDAMLRAALLLSSGDPKIAQRVPQQAAFTLGLREGLGARTPGFEESEAAVAFARRLDRAPKPGNLVNLGWGALLQNLPRSRADEQRPSPPGTLADAIHRAGGQTAALGSADVTVNLQESTPLREWALVASDSNGTVDSGDLTARLLARDRATPFGLRSNRKAVLQALDAVFQKGQTGLVAIEWGDTRRAQEYSAFCAPDVAASHRQAALRSADAFIQALVGNGSTLPARLTAPRDRLLVVVVPDLHSRAPQWLPVAYWRPGRGGQGALLEKTSGGEGLGAIGLENMHARLIAPLNVANASTLPPSVRERGGPQKAADRISKLLSFQSGLSWLENSRDFFHAIWCAFFILSCALTLWALRHLQSTRAARYARLAWCATMIVPWLLWLFGLCVETTWRFGSGGASFKLIFSLLLVACLVLFLIGATFNWFGHAKLHRIRIGVIWLLLSIAGLWIGGFGLPWNALLHLAPNDASIAMSTPGARIGEVWALLLISATMLAISGLSKARSALAVRNEVGEPRRVLNIRPSLIWIVILIAVLWTSGLGRDATAATIALLACGTMWLRMWLERSPRETRLLHRRIVFGAIAVGVLLLWQRGAAGGLGENFALWRSGWNSAWNSGWWSAALLALLALVFAFAFTGAREVLRNYLAPRYSLRAMLGGTALASLAGLFVYGPAAPPLLATFTLGAIAHEVLGASEETSHQ